MSFIKESLAELKNNVTWTPWAEAQRLMIIVVIFSVLFSLLIWGIDSLFGKVITGYFNLING